VLELLDRLLDAFKSHISKPELDVDTLTEWGKMVTDAKDIILEGAHDINDAGRLALQTSGVMQLNTRDAFLAKVPYACPMSVKDNLRQAPLGGPTLFTEDTVTSAIEAKVTADNVDFQKRVLSDKKTSGSQAKSQFQDRGSRKDRADSYRDQDKSSGQSNFRGGGNRQNDGSQDRKPRYNQGGQKSERGNGKGAGRGRGQQRRNSYESYDNSKSYNKH
jgi:hypothetical protein